jgi:acyl-coenzyme A synthetase/AMP-(fatty) acid ligase
MGHRIELGEIEVNVNMMEGIQTSCCIYDKETDKIVLFFVGDMELKELVTILRNKLPRYMIPNKVLKLDTMPLTANGKLNRVELTKMFKEGK